MDFAGKVALVTGSSSGIGAAIARELGAKGAAVAVHYRSNQAGAEEVVAQIRQENGACTLYQADVADPEAAALLVKSVEEELGTIQILVNNAGVTADALLVSMKQEAWDRVIQTNLTSTYSVTRAALRKMLWARWGRIINMTSVSGLGGQAGQTNYAASKAGIIGFTKSLAKEVGSRNITVNAVAPGFIPTALTDVLTEEQRAQAIAATPVGRLGEPEEVAWAVAFLASERSSFITGHVLTVDGGLVMM